MTLCVSWLREMNDEQELVFATDSHLSGGERWSGIKLFELPRKDCLICFAGETNRTYPLILNLIASIKFDEHLSRVHTDIAEVLDYLTQLFTSHCHSISGYGTRDLDSVVGDFQFLFGGWSWKANMFKLWRLEYDHETKEVKYEETNTDDMLYAFIGDESDKAEELLEEQLISSNRGISRRFDMEPLKVLVQMIRNPDYYSIGGAVQMARIHPPGLTEFLGIYWPSISGEKTFLGRNVGTKDNPIVKFIDPDTGELVEEDLPEQLSPIEESVYGESAEFLSDCYPEGYLKEGIGKREKARIKEIVTRVAYTQFMERQQEEAGEE